MRVPTGLVVVVEDHGCIAVEANGCAVVATHFLGRANDNGFPDVAFLHAASRGMASFTDTTMTSPTDWRIYDGENHPDTLMHCTRRAPLLSATSRVGLHLDHLFLPTFEGLYVPCPQGFDLC